MAEINVEKKKSKWLWIILAAVILGIILLVFLFQDGNVDEENPDQLEEVTLAPRLLLHSSNVKFLQELHAPFRIKIEALV
ncbi:hypothetical protein [Autumnicola psychrophila]|uniref:Uncharacterized protein n=1 Tax=Autumnicola psychrophila TaxID=3075592 RepID=A0ABU3DV31_9FLAO|nr:hypothetical protein [Zunongwangia sp. F225]MDT0687573.1 hypothetical protein [Zunongwangia sp. F225]